MFNKISFWLGCSLNWLCKLNHHKKKRGHPGLALGGIFFFLIYTRKFARALQRGRTLLQSNTMSMNQDRIICQLIIFIRPNFLHEELATMIHSLGSAGIWFMSLSVDGMVRAANNNMMIGQYLGG